MRPFLGASLKISRCEVCLEDGEPSEYVQNIIDEHELVLEGKALSTKLRCWPSVTQRIGNFKSPIQSFTRSAKRGNHEKWCRGH
jgi:hypothetical protein